ncbi:hypothetical protein J3E68DRAFT_416016 [Trichoderma sp. SZMC 28012]
MITCLGMALLASGVKTVELYLDYQVRLAALNAPDAPLTAPLTAPATAVNSPSGEPFWAQFYTSVRGLLAQDDTAAAATADAGALPSTETNAVVGFFAPVWRGVVAPAMDAFAGGRRTLAKRQVMLANYVNRFFPEANPLWGLGAAAVYGWMFRG